MGCASWVGSFREAHFLEPQNGKGLHECDDARDEDGVCFCFALLAGLLCFAR